MNFFQCIGGERLIAAHRGARSTRPENTMSAFERALGRSDFLEVDVQCSQDSLPVIVHDATLQRTTNVAELPAFARRAPWRVHDFTFEELLQLDFGSWFLQADPFHTLRDGRVGAAELAPLLPQSLPTLEQLLQFVRKHGYPVNIEIKDLTEAPHHERVVERVLDVIHSVGCAPLVLISSMQHEYLQQVAARAPDVSTAALEEHRHPAQLIDYLQRLGVCAYNPADAITDAALVARLNQAGFSVNVFTVNDPERKAELFTMGVRSIFTDFL